VPAGADWILGKSTPAHVGSSLVHRTHLHQEFFMSLRSVLDALRTIPLLPRPTARRAGFRPRLEPLDDRWVPSFSPAVNYGVGDNPVAVATGYLNADNHLDLVTANQFVNTVSVRFGDGLGGFGGEHVHAVGASPVSVVVGDFDGDGNNDLATANAGSWDVTVLPGNGDGTFDAAVNTAVWSGEPTSLAVGDFDDDGKMDLVAGTNYSYYYPWYGWYDYKYAEVLMGFGEGDGGGFGVQSANYVVFAWSTGYEVDVAVGDLDGDLDDDVVAVNTPGNSVGVLLGNNDGSFGWVGEYSAGNWPQAVAIGDFTSDDIPDLVVAGQGVSILRGDGGGGFVATTGYDGGGPWADVAVGDLNGDDNLDVVAVNSSTGAVSPLLSLGDGALFRIGDHAAGSSPRAMAAGDFDGDNRADAAVANAGSDSVSVLLNDGDWPSLDSRLTIDDVVITEGYPGTFQANFVVTLSTPSSDSTTVDYTTRNGSATAGSDYQLTSGTLTIPAGQTTGTIVVPILPDRLVEANETFSVRLSNSVNAIITDEVAGGTILDDEPRISITDVARSEGGKGQKTTFEFTVTLSVAYDQPVTMSFRTVDGTAKKGEDYTSRSGTLTFLPGETTKKITIEVKGDTRRESNETFYLDLLGSNDFSVFTKSRGVGTILNDD
jgi:hypothetical protein